MIQDNIYCLELLNQFIMKKMFSLKQAIMFVAVVLCGMTGSLTAATITVSSDAVTATNYNTIQAAYDYVKALPALTEKYVIEIQSTYDPTKAPTLETFPITFAANTATKDFDITIKPADGVKVTLAALNKTVIYTNLSFASGATTLNVPSTTGVSSGMAVYGMGINFITLTGPSYKYATVTAIDDVSAQKTLTLSNGATGASTADKKIFVGTPGTQTIVFDGAKYVTIDGVSRTTTTGLTIQNPNSINCQTIYFKNNAQYNTVQSCIVRGANISGNINNGTGGTIYFGGAQYNTISNNDVCDMNDVNIPYPICSFQVSAGGGTNANNTISSNNIYNISNLHSPNGPFTFMQFGGESAAVGNKVLSNRFYWTKPTSFSTAGINFLNYGTMGLGNQLENNVIGYGASDGSGRSTLTFGGAGGTSYVIANVKNSTCKGNTIGGMDIVGKVLVGIQVAVHTSQGTLTADDVCYDNKVQDITINSAFTGATFYGIMMANNFAFPFNLKKNVVKNVTIYSPTATNTCAMQGIIYNYGFTSPNIVNCIENEVSNLTAGCVASTGIAASSAANSIIAFVQGGPAALIEKNLIYNLNTISTGTGSTIKGLQFALSNTTGATVKNNIVRLGNDVTSDAEISAIYHTAASNSLHIFNFYHNTIYIGGTSATKNSHSYNRTGVIAGTITFKNNILSNVRTGGTSAINQVYNLYALADIATSENNLYQYGSKFATVTTTSPATYAALSDWNTARLAVTPTALSEDANSKDQLDPQFTAATGTTAPDMHLSSSSPANESGLTIATVTDDFAGALRSDYTTASTTNADMGAYAISNATAVQTAQQISDLSVFALENSIVFNNLSGFTAKIYSLSGQLVKSIALTSNRTSEPTSKGLYIVKVADKVTKVLVK
jgi:hypothetical protein